MAAFALNVILRTHLTELEKLNILTFDLICNVINYDLQVKFLTPFRKFIYEHFQNSSAFR